ncbi:MAG: hypothetical protein RJA81_2028, partial [Planctomycetota bacterium]
NSSDTKLMGGSENTDGDFTTIGDEEFLNRLHEVRYRFEGLRLVIVWTGPNWIFVDSS